MLYIFLLQDFSDFQNGSNEKEQGNAEQNAESDAHLARYRNFTLEWKSRSKREIPADHSVQIIEKLVGIDPDDAF